MPRGVWRGRSPEHTSISVQRDSPRLSDDEHAYEDEPNEEDMRFIAPETSSPPRSEASSYQQIDEAEEKLAGQEACSTTSGSESDRAEDADDEEPDKEPEYDEQEMHPAAAVPEPARRGGRPVPPAKARAAANSRAAVASTSVLRERAPECTPAACGRRGNSSRFWTPAADDKENRPPSTRARTSEDQPRSSSNQAGESSKKTGRGRLKRNADEEEVEEVEGASKPAVIELSSDEGEAPAAPPEERSGGRRRLRRNASPAEDSEEAAERPAAPARPPGAQAPVRPGRLRRLKRLAPSESSEEEEGEAAGPGLSPPEEPEDEPLVRRPRRRSARAPFPESSDEGEEPPPVKAEPAPAPPLEGDSVPPLPPETEDVPPPPPYEADAAPPPVPTEPSLEWVPTEPTAEWVGSDGEGTRDEEEAAPAPPAADGGGSGESDDSFLERPTFDPARAGPRAASSVPFHEGTRRSSGAPAASSSEPPRRSGAPAASSSDPRGRQRRQQASPAASSPEPHSRQHRQQASPVASSSEPRGRQGTRRRPKLSPPPKRRRQSEPSPRPRRPPAKARRSKNTKHGYANDEFVRSDSDGVELSSGAEAPREDQEVRNRYAEEKLQKGAAKDEADVGLLKENMRADPQRPLANGLLPRLDKDKFRGVGDVEDRNRAAHKEFVRLLFRKHKNRGLEPAEEERLRAAQEKVDDWLFGGWGAVQCNVWRKVFNDVLQSRPVLKEDQCHGYYERCASCNHPRGDLTMLWFEGPEYDGKLFWRTTDHRARVKLTDPVGLPVGADCWLIARKWHYLFHYKYYLTNVLWNMSDREERVHSAWIAEEFASASKVINDAKEYRRDGKADRDEGFQRFEVFGGQVGGARGAPRLRLHAQLARELDVHAGPAPPGLLPARAREPRPRSSSH